jgi:hypothetical protein
MLSKREKLRRTVQAFREGVLDGEAPDRMCFVLSIALDSYLGFCGTRCELVKGQVFDCEHFWLKLIDTGEILDATADQFRAPDGSEMPRVYIGAQPDWYTTGGSDD